MLLEVVDEILELTENVLVEIYKEEELDKVEEIVKDVDYIEEIEKFKLNNFIILVDSVILEEK